MHMSVMKRRAVAFGCVVLGGMLATGACAAVPDWSLIPQPAVTQPAANGAVTVASGDRVALLAPDTSKAQGIVKRFIARVDTLRGLHLQPAASADKARIVLRLDPGLASGAKAAYRIDIDDGRITASASTLRGLFYASVTVGQLLTPDAARGTVKVADGVIEDHPRFQWRGLMLDSARHFQSVADIKRLIDWMALAKLNVLHWHLTDDQGWRLEIKQYPKLTTLGNCRKAVGPDAALTGGPDKPYCGYYTQDQVRDIVAYAAKRFITIVPEIEMPGHAQAAIAAYPELGVTGERPKVSTDWGVNPWLYAPDQRSLTFLENVLDEVMKLFPSHYIHIGGDEARKDQWLASDAVQAKHKALGLDDMDQLQGWMVDKIGAYLTEHGRVMVGWDEILEGGDLPDSAVVMSWRGVKGGIEAAKTGHDTILAPSPTMYLDHVQTSAHDQPPGRPVVESLKDIYTFDPMPGDLPPQQTQHFIGVQANLWAEYMPTFARVQQAVFPRLAALSEVAWSPASVVDWPDFRARMIAQVARYKALGVAYSDAAWAPRFKLAADGDKVHVTLSNQLGQGEIRYTTDGSAPTTTSRLYTDPLTLPGTATTELKTATFAASGLRLAATRTRDISAASLLTRNSDQLAACRQRLTLRLEDDRPLDGPRPVYKVNIMDTCWQWHDAPLDGIDGISFTVGNMPWNYALLDKDLDVVVVRPDSAPAGHIEVHLDTCKGRRLARLPLAKAAGTRGQTTLSAPLPEVRGRHDLCLEITGDPRKGRLWAIDTVTLTR
ncbi:MAG TPA: family 20 glycosylhydrolase [Oleiagrimonas sp.]|nr:family 20 glycosylhydrolase [Oleiagrimonas sp.]